MQEEVSRGPQMEVLILVRAKQARAKEDHIRTYVRTYVHTYVRTYVHTMPRTPVLFVITAAAAGGASPTPS